MKDRSETGVTQDRFGLPRRRVPGPDRVGPAGSVPNRREMRPAGDAFAEHPPENVITHHGGASLRGVAVMTMNDHDDIEPGAGRDPGRMSADERPTARCSASLRPIADAPR